MHPQKKIIRELIVGDVRSESASVEFLNEGFADLLKTVRKAGCISLVSFAKNPFENFISEKILLQNHFRKINRTIFFCYKSFTEIPALQKPGAWIIFRSDIDTW